MPYYPQSRFIPGQTAKLGQFQTPDGKDYLGSYYITSDGKCYTGDNPKVKNSIPLIKNQILEETQNIKYINSPINQKYTKLNPNLQITEYQEPISFLPKPTDEDYKKGKITRYFAKERKVRIFKIIEINQFTFEDIVNMGGIYNYPGWDVISMFWQISGPLENELINGNIIKSGIKNTNQRIIDIKNKQFIGLKEFITNLTQFSKT